MPYFGVRDADETTAKVTAGGGAVRMAPFDTPYGRLAVVADPQGAVFSIMQDTGGGGGQG